MNISFLKNFSNILFFTFLIISFQKIKTENPKYNYSSILNHEPKITLDFIFDEKGNLQKSYSWESHEGGESALYFLNNEKIYCLKTIRIVGEGGIFTQIPVPCNLPKRMEDGDELPYFLLIFYF